MEWTALERPADFFEIEERNTDFYNLNNDASFLDDNDQNNSCWFEEVVQINHDYLPSGHSSDSGNYSPTTSASYEVKQLDFCNSTSSVSFPDLFDAQQQVNISSTSTPKQHFMPNRQGQCQNIDANTLKQENNALFTASHRQQSLIFDTTSLPVNPCERQLLTCPTFNNNGNTGFPTQNPITYMNVLPIHNGALYEKVHNGLTQDFNLNSVNTLQPKSAKAATYIQPSNSQHKNFVIKHAPAVSVIQFPINISKKMPLNSDSNLHSTVMLDNEYVKKKEDRKMRNRESAQLSRQRKKEEQSQMKIKLEQVNRKIKLLTEENKNLHIRITELENENKMLKSNNAGSLELKQKWTINSAITLNNPERKSRRMTLKCICIFILIGWMVFPSPEYKNLSDKKLSAHKIKREKSMYKNTQNSHGRSLYPSSEETAILNQMDMVLINASTNANNSLIGCGSSKFYNETLNIKLSRDLFTWILRHEQIDGGKQSPLIGTAFLRGIPSLLQKFRISSTNFEATTNDDYLKSRIKTNIRLSKSQKRQKQRKQRTAPTLLKQKSIRTLGSLISIIDDTSNNRIHHIKEVNGNVGNSYNNIKKNDGHLWTNGINGIPPAQHMVKLLRDNDRNNHDNNTLYVIALHDYFLLPPTANINNGKTNKTGKPPRLSIILPALSPPHNSSSTLFNQRSMMRIECEVVDTDVFYLPEVLVNFLSDFKQQ